MKNYYQPAIGECIEGQRNPESVDVNTNVQKKRLSSLQTWLRVSLCAALLAFANADASAQEPMPGQKELPKMKRFVQPEFKTLNGLQRIIDADFVDCEVVDSSKPMPENIVNGLMYIKDDGWAYFSTLEHQRSSGVLDAFLAKRQQHTRQEVQKLGRALPVGFPEPIATNKRINGIVSEFSAAYLSFQFQYGDVRGFAVNNHAHNGHIDAPSFTDGTYDLNFLSVNNVTTPKNHKGSFPMVRLAPSTITNATLPNYEVELVGVGDQVYKINGKPILLEKEIAINGKSHMVQTLSFKINPKLFSHTCQFKGESTGIGVLSGTKQAVCITSSVLPVYYPRQASSNDRYTTPANVTKETHPDAYLLNCIGIDQMRALRLKVLQHRFPDYKGSFDQLPQPLANASKLETTQKHPGVQTARQRKISRRKQARERAAARGK
jgi:hypothetical protein